MLLSINVVLWFRYKDQVQFIGNCVICKFYMLIITSTVKVNTHIISKLDVKVTFVMQFQ